MKIRLVNAKRDLLTIADLIESSFSGYLDIDGKNYIQQIRRAAQNPQYRLWFPGAGEWVSSPVFGYVCEINGKVVGNLSLIPFNFQHQWIYLIANVAVHENFRNQGIARRLTAAAIEHVKKNNVSAVWLQVRADNEIAIHLYRSLGFEERAIRTNWQYEHNSTLFLPATPEEVKIIPRDRSHWAMQKKWLSVNYPSEISWYLSYSESRFSPSILQKISQTVTGNKIKQWAACNSEELIGVVTWQPTSYHADTLWLAAPDEQLDQAIYSLIPETQRELNNGKPLLINFPAGKGENAFQALNFSIHNTLIWMKIQLL